MNQNLTHSKPKSRNISVVIPAFNEEKRIEPTIKKIMKYLSTKFNKYEIIIIDDFSQDNTNKLVSKYMKINKNTKLIKNEKNRGKGYSVKRGILAAKYSKVLFSDSDLATPIEELDKMLNFTNEYDVIIASRNLKTSDVRTKQPIYRVILGKTFPKLVNLLILKDIKDTQCGFKLFNTDAAKKIVSLQTFDRFSFDVELLVIARKLGLKIKEVPVTWIDKKGSKVSPVRDSILMLFDLFKIKYNYLTGKYDKKKVKE